MLQSRDVGRWRMPVPVPALVRQVAQRIGRATDAGRVLRGLALSSCFAASLASAQPTPPAAPAPAVAATSAAPAVTLPTMRLRGSIESVDATHLTLRERDGRSIVLVYADNFAVSEIVAIELSAIQPGSFIGTAAMPQPDGTLRALALAVFPESARGAVPTALRAQAGRNGVVPPM